MTTIIRCGKHLLCDNRYLNLKGASVVTHDGPPKFFKHETGVGVIAISGGISNYAVWKALEADFSQILLDLNEYPEKLPSFENVFRLLDEKDDGSAILQAHDAGIPHTLIATEKWTVTLLTDSSKKTKPSISIYPAHEFIALGSGGDFATMHHLMNTEQVNNQSLVKALIAATRGDLLSGGKIYHTELTWGKA